jgi:hypothetical protein
MAKDIGSGFFYRSLRDLKDTDQNVTQSSNNESSRNNLGLSDLTESKQLNSNYEIRTQSTRFFDDMDSYNIGEINKLLRGDLIGRTLEVTDRVAEALFPDEAFGFPINSSFISNFQGSFLNASGYLDPKNLRTDKTTSAFFNGMISTIAKFLRSTKQHPLEYIQPLRYFVSSHSTKPVDGSSMKRMPDLMLVRLINGCTRDGPMTWIDPQALAEHTTEQKPPIRMVESTIAKDYLSFCAQSERDFMINLLITGEGFHIVIADRTGLLETDVIPFDRATSVSILIRMVMGLAFLPDQFLGIDTTITRLEIGSSSGKKFEDTFPPLSYAIPQPHIPLLSPSSSPLSKTRPLEVAKSADQPSVTISIGDAVYTVTKAIFESKSFIGRATKIYLVQTGSGLILVLKDSWMSIRRPHEATYLEGLSFPFCPTLINRSSHGNTQVFRCLAVKPSLVKEIREKRRSVTRPAGVHISDFSSLWELMVAFLDITLGVYGSIFVGCFSYPLLLPQPSCISCEKKGFIVTFHIQMFFFEKEEGIQMRSSAPGTNSCGIMVCPTLTRCGEPSSTEKDCLLTMIMRLS